MVFQHWLLTSRLLGMNVSDMEFIFLICSLFHFIWPWMTGVIFCHALWQRCLTPCGNERKECTFMCLVEMELMSSGAWR